MQTLSAMVYFVNDPYCGLFFEAIDYKTQAGHPSGFGRTQGRHGGKQVRIKLSYKMFGALLLTSFVVVALLTGIMRFYVFRNFTSYVTHVELEKLGAAVTALANEYRRQGGWTALSGSPRRFGKLLERIQGDLSSEETGEPRVPKTDLTDMPPPNFHGFIASPEAHGPPYWPRWRLPRRVLRRLSLYDAQQRLVVGRPRKREDSFFRKITVDGRTVGWLALEKPKRSSNRLAEAFFREQSKIFMFSGGGILLLAALVSLFLSRHLLAPIRILTEGTRALTALKFSTRIHVKSGDELGQLAEAFNIMANTLEKYEQRQKQGVSDISHELRTPLSILRGEIEAMQDGIRKSSPEALDSLHAEVLHIGKIVEDLHQLAMADAGALNVCRNPVDPLQVLSDTVAQFRPRLQRAGIAVEIFPTAPQEVTVAGDEHRLAQLYSNLLENTLRYVQTPGILTIWSQRRADGLWIGFDDSGPGVPTEALGRLFDRLYRVDAARTRNMGGSGLGLAICQSIVKAHGGSITAEHAVSGGLGIRIRLPLRPDQ